MALTDYLSWQLQEKKWFQLFLYALLTSRISGWVTVFAFSSVCALLPMFGSVRSASMSILWSESYYSTIVALGLMRQQVFWNMIRKMQALVHAMGAHEQWGPGGTKWAVTMRRNVVWSSGALLWVGTMIIVSMWLRILATGRPLCPMWPFYPHARPYGTWARWSEMVATGLFISVPVCTVGFLVAALSFLTCSAAGLHHALAHRLNSEPTAEDVSEVLRLHQEVRILSLEFTEFFAGSMAQLMAGPIGNSLLATLQVLANDMDENTFSQIFVVVVTLLQVSYLSQELMDSSMALKKTAYLTAASAHSPAEARALLLVILVAARPPALSCKGLGRLSLPAAGRILREFYSAVNVLGPRYSQT